MRRVYEKDEDITKRGKEKLEERNTWLGTERYRSIGVEVLLEGTMI